MRVRTETGMTTMSDSRPSREVEWNAFSREHLDSLLRDEYEQFYGFITQPYEYFSNLKAYRPDLGKGGDLFLAASPLGTFWTFRFNFIFSDDTIFSCYSEELDWPELSFAKEKITVAHYAELCNFIKENNISGVRELTYKCFIGRSMDDLLKRLLKPLYDEVVFDQSYRSSQRVEILRAAKRKITDFIEITRAIKHPHELDFDDLKKKEKYQTRKDRHENALEFLKRVYRVELENGLTQKHVRQADFFLYRALHEWCKYNKYEVRQFLEPSRTNKKEPPNRAEISTPSP